MMNARTLLALVCVAVCASVASASTRNLQQSIYIPGIPLTISVANVLPFYFEGLFSNGLFDEDGPFGAASSYLDYGVEELLSGSVRNLGNLGIEAASGGQDYLTVG
jgi:hypothetical protein